MAMDTSRMTAGIDTIILKTIEFKSFKITAHTIAARVPMHTQGAESAIL